MVKVNYSTRACRLTASFNLAVILSLVAPAVILASGVPKIALHAATPSAKNACTRAAALPNCDSISVAGDLYPQTYFVYALVVEADSTLGISGVSFGIDYEGASSDGVDVYSWSRCSDLEFPTEYWPASGSGNTLTWVDSTNCQRQIPSPPGDGVWATLGYFYCTAYTADVLSIVERLDNGLVELVPCDYDPGDSTIVVSTMGGNTDRLGAVAFSASAATPGSNPCGAD